VPGQFFNAQKKVLEYFRGVEEKGEEKSGFVGASSWIKREDRYYFLFFVNLIKQPVFANSIPPGFRFPVHKFFYIITKMRFISQLRVNIIV
jgi:hypothetical protein